ncbi:MAG: DUF1116 domain-containing protein [Candidatus Cloacimonetes bacterium]|nr:DUF1116 domain-containing protein [Candidatus Cloacimonadota bacterium]
MKLREGKLKVINLGLEQFGKDLKEQNVETIQVNWSPPLEIDSSIMQIIAHHQEEIDQANEKALDIIQKGQPVLLGLDIARNVIPGMQENMILHAGPPIQWDRMCGPMRGAIIGALIYEGKAATKEEAENLAKSGEIEYAPCHEHNAVGPMAGIISPSMPVFIIKNDTYGNEAYCTQNEGLGKVLRYGAYQSEVIEKLKWMEKVLYPILDKAIRSLGKIDLKNLISQALHMGDEVHNRNRAGTSLLIRQLAPAILKTSENVTDSAKVLEFINSNDHFFLNLSMPAAKCMLDAASNIVPSSIVIAMARNGTDFGIRLAGTGNKWFTGKALIPDALFFPGYTKEDANPDIGDSTITETAGLGGFAIAAAFAIAQFVGGTAADAKRYTNLMYEITATESENFQIPALDFRGTPLGIDVRKVIEKNLTPFLDTGVAHKQPGIGQVGAGVLSAPTEPFINAIKGLAKVLE